MQSQPHLVLCTLLFATHTVVYLSTSYCRDVYVVPCGTRRCVMRPAPELPDTAWLTELSRLPKKDRTLEAALSHTEKNTECRAVPSALCSPACIGLRSPALQRAYCHMSSGRTYARRARTTCRSVPLRLRPPVRCLIKLLHFVLRSVSYNATTLRPPVRCLLPGRRAWT